MAAQYLKDRGIDLQHEMDKAQECLPLDKPSTRERSATRISIIKNVKLSGRVPHENWDISIKDGKIGSAQPSHHSQRGFTDSPTVLGDANPFDGRSQLLLPSLCHPHIHLDKCFLLSHSKYDDLEIIKGDFSEALELTSKAKERFEEDDLMTRGEWLIKESIAAGVTHMRGFVEIDNTVRFKCLDAGMKLKEKFKDRCKIQICVFAQDPVFSPSKNFPEGKALIEEALTREGVDVIGSTPYVEESEESMRKNVDWVVAIAVKFRKHLDLHLDYNLDTSQPPLIYYVLDRLHEEWTANDKHKSIVFGHCTRLTFLDIHEWRNLKTCIAGLPIYFVGLPTSDLFMMGRPGEGDGGGYRARGTLQIPQMMQQYDLKGAIGVNNVGNAFTPQGTCDPMSIASTGVGIYQAGTKVDAQLLYDCVSSDAKAAIGYPQPKSPYDEGAAADFVLFQDHDSEENDAVTGRQRRTVQDIIYDPPRRRQTIMGGCLNR